MFATIVTCVVLAPWSLIVAIGIAAVKLKRQREANATAVGAVGPEWRRFAGLGDAPTPMREEVVDTASVVRGLKDRGYRGSIGAPFPAARPRHS